MLLLTRIAGSEDGRDEVVLIIPGYDEEVILRFYRSSNRHQVRVGIKAPHDIVIMRGELLPANTMADDQEEDASTGTDGAGG